MYLFAYILLTFLRSLYKNLVFDKNFGEKKSSTKNDETNPIYNETFTWEIPSNMGINNLVLWVKIMDDDLLKDDKIGKCKINLEDLDLSPTPLSLERVVDNNILTKDARIYLKISYQP
jgi:Ca2+-dependent lipid-binding protein